MDYLSLYFAKKMYFTNKTNYEERKVYIPVICMGLILMVLVLKLLLLMMMLLLLLILWLGGAG